MKVALGKRGKLLLPDNCPAKMWFCPSFPSEELTAS